MLLDNETPIPEDSLIDTNVKLMAHVTINSKELSLPIVDEYSYAGKDYMFCCDVNNEYNVYVIDKAANVLVTDTELIQQIQEAFNAEVEAEESKRV